MNLQSFYMITIILELLVIIIVAIKALFGFRRERDELREEKGQWLGAKSKLSLIEAKAREFREGKNIFTVMRDIQDIVWKEEDNEESK